MSRRGNRCQNVRLSWQYIDLKGQFVIFQISAKKVSRLDERNFMHSLNESRGSATWLLHIITPKNIQKCAGNFCQARWLICFWVIRGWNNSIFHVINEKICHHIPPSMYNKSMYTKIMYTRSMYTKSMPQVQRESELY